LLPQKALGKSRLLAQSLFAAKHFSPSFFASLLLKGFWQKPWEKPNRCCDLMLHHFEMLYNSI